MVLLAPADKTRECCLGVSHGEAELRASRRERVEARCSFEEQIDICSQKIRLSAHRKKCIKGREHLQRTERTLNFLFLTMKSSWQEGIGMGIFLKSTLLVQKTLRNN